MTKKIPQYVALYEDLQSKFCKCTPHSKKKVAMTNIGHRNVIRYQFHDENDWWMTLMIMINDKVKNEDDAKLNLNFRWRRCWWKHVVSMSEESKIWNWREIFVYASTNMIFFMVVIMGVAARINRKQLLLIVVKIYFIIPYNISVLQISISLNI